MAISSDDKARVFFMFKLESEGGLEALYHYNGLDSKDLPENDRLVFERLASAMRDAYRLTATYQRTMDNLSEEEMEKLAREEE